MRELTIQLRAIERNVRGVGTSDFVEFLVPHNDAIMVWLIEALCPVRFPERMVLAVIVHSPDHP